MKLKYWLFVVGRVVVVKNCKTGVQVFDFFAALCRQYPVTYRITSISYPSSVSEVLGGSDVVSGVTMTSNMFLNIDADFLVVRPTKRSAMRSANLANARTTYSGLLLFSK